MDQEEFIICDDATIKKEFQEFQDPLSVEEVPLNDPLSPQTGAVPETEQTIKQERITSWSSASIVENEEDQEMVIDDRHTDNIPADSEVASYPENQREEMHEEPAAKSTMAPFITSNCLQSPPPPSPSPPRSPFDAIALNCHIASVEAPASASNLQIDQNDSSNASVANDGLGNISPSHEQESAESHFPEIIYVDSDSENEQRNSQVASLNNSESSVWSKNIDVAASSGVIFKVESINEERVMQDAVISSNSKSEKVKVIKSPKKTKPKKRKLLKRSETSSSSQLILPAGEPVTRQSLIGLGEMYMTAQGQQTLPTSQQIVPPGQQTIAPSQSVLSLNQHNSLQNQTWTPIHQLLALSSQILSQQQSIAPVQSAQIVSQQQSITPVQGSQLLNQLSATPGQSSQLVSQSSVSSLQGPQLLSQQSPRPPQPILTSLLKTTAQNKVIPPKSQKFGSAQSAKKPKPTGVNTSETEVKHTTAKTQAEVNTGNNAVSESELMNLKHKMTVQELKLRLRNRKVKAELEESELKMKMEASMQELSNKKLKHEILLAKLQFYTKLCATKNL